jgi:hypothetical protein
MAKRLRRRFAQMEQSVSELKRRIAPIEKDYAWDHAVAVAAIVLSGQPKIDEPLQRAWRRTLRSYEITLKDPDSWHDQVISARQLVHLIMDKANESAQFTQIFRDVGILQRVLAGVHHEVPVVVAFLRGMYGVERYRQPRFGCSSLRAPRWMLAY